MFESIWFWYAIGALPMIGILVIAKVFERNRDDLEPIARLNACTRERCTHKAHRDAHKYGW